MAAFDGQISGDYCRITGIFRALRVMAASNDACYWYSPIPYYSAALYSSIYARLAGSALIFILFTPREFDAEATNYAPLIDDFWHRRDGMPFSAGDTAE